jgi:hypothetical protein
MDKYTHKQSHTDTSHTWNKHKVRFIKERLVSHKQDHDPELSLLQRRGPIAGGASGGDLSLCYCSNLHGHGNLIPEVSS